MGEDEEEGDEGGSEGGGEVARLTSFVFLASPSCPTYFSLPSSSSSSSPCLSSEVQLSSLHLLSSLLHFSSSLLSQVSLSRDSCSLAVRHSALLLLLSASRERDS